MKKILLAVTAALAITGCSQNEDEVIINNGNSVEINLNGGVEATTVSRAAINKGEALSGIQFVRVDGNDIGTLEDFSNVTITGAMAAGGAITFSPVQYYQGEYFRLLSSSNFYYSWCGNYDHYRR